MGYGAARNLTAVGDTLNAASRLEGLAKDFDVEIVISEDLAALAGLDLGDREHRTLAMRGRTQPIGAWIIPDAADLSLRGLSERPLGSGSE